VNAFEASLRARSAANHADFLLPYLKGDFLVLDVGCGEGMITVGLADPVSNVVGVDREDEELAGVRLVEHLQHRVAQAGVEVEALVEIRRVIKAGASSASPASSTAA
jgi:2-polyprenyl-3-methyl-5-hydroxy-6-metoxy-1,4-benzoquinol methylase